MHRARAEAARRHVIGAFAQAFGMSVSCFAWRPRLPLGLSEMRQIQTGDGVMRQARLHSRQPA